MPHVKRSFFSIGSKPGLKERLRFEGHIQGVTISRTADKWFISLQVATDQRPAQCENQASVGVDLGIKDLATLSNLEKFPGSKPLKRYLLKLRRKHRQLSKKQKGSNNRNKEKRKLSRLHFRIRCIRGDTLHKLTTYLTSNFGTIILEKAVKHGKARLDFYSQRLTKNRDITHEVRPCFS